MIQRQSNNLRRLKDVKFFVTKSERSFLTHKWKERLGHLGHKKDPKLLCHTLFLFYFTPTFIGYFPLYFINLIVNHIIFVLYRRVSSMIIYMIFLDVESLILHFYNCCTKRILILVFFSFERVDIFFVWIRVYEISFAFNGRTNSI